MKNIFSVIVISAALAGCTAAQEQQVATDIGLGATDLSDVCTAAAPLVPAAAVAASTAPTTATGNLGASINKVCTVAGGVATALDPTGQPVDPSWLEGVIQAFETAAQLAPIILPAI